MANLHFEDGVAGNCTVSGTGAYTGITAIAGYTSFASLTDGRVVECSVRTATAFETGKYTKSGGSTPTLTRTRVLSQIDLSANPVNWASSTQVLIHSALSAKDAASITGENEYETHQHLKGQHLTLTTDKLSYLYGPTNGLAAFVVNGIFHTSWGIGASGEPYMTITHTDSGALVGPGIYLDRVSSSAAIGDFLGYVSFAGRDDAGNFVDYARLTGQIGSPVNGAEYGGLALTVQRAGAPVTATEWSGNYLKAFPGFSDSSTAILVGKSVASSSNQGIELIANGQGAFTTVSTPCLSLNLKGADGQLIYFARDTVFVGDIKVAAGVVTLTGASMAHNSLWDDPRPPLRPPLGSLLCSTDRLLEDLSGVHPYARLSTEAGDPSVYGVYGGKSKVQLRDKTTQRGLTVQASGAGSIQVIGPIRHGQLLQSSDIPGVARGQASRSMQDSTVAKARATVPDGERRLIPCTLMAG